MDNYEDYGFEEEKEEASWWHWGIGFGIGLVIGATVLGKYEGMTAEEWFNQYDYENARYIELRDCVETYYENPDDLYYNCL